MTVLLVVGFLVLLVAIIAVKVLMAGKEGEEPSGISKFISENKVLVTAYVGAILFLGVLVWGVLTEAPSWVLEVSGTGIAVCVIVEQLFRRRYH